MEGVLITVPAYFVTYLLPVCMYACLPACLPTAFTFPSIDNHIQYSYDMIALRMFAADSLAPTPTVLSCTDSDSTVGLGLENLLVSVHVLVFLLQAPSSPSVVGEYGLRIRLEDQVRVALSSVKCGLLRLKRPHFTIHALLQSRTKRKKDGRGGTVAT